MIDLGDIDPILQADVAGLAADMRAHGYQRADPVREVFALLGDRWTTLILLVLNIGAWRHADLRRVLGRLAAEGRISQRVLTLKLRALERDGFVARHATADVPPMVSYALTPLGRDLVAQARIVMAWIHASREAIHAARDAYDAAKS